MLPRSASMTSVARDWITTSTASRSMAEAIAFETSSSELRFRSVGRDGVVMRGLYHPPPQTGRQAAKVR